MSKQTFGIDLVFEVSGASERVNVIRFNVGVVNMCVFLPLLPGSEDPKTLGSRTRKRAISRLTERSLQTSPVDKSGSEAIRLGTSRPASNEIAVGRAPHQKFRS